MIKALEVENMRLFRSSGKKIFNVEEKGLSGRKNCRRMAKTGTKLAASSKPRYRASDATNTSFCLEDGGGCTPPLSDAGAEAIIIFSGVSKAVYPRTKRILTEESCRTSGVDIGRCFAATKASTLITVIPALAMVQQSRQRTKGLLRRSTALAKR